MRIKPNAGMVELDVPMDVWHNYDKGKGVTWGEAMKKSNSSKGGGSHGLPGGFGIGGAQPGGRGRNRGIEDREADQQRVLDDYKGAVEREQVLVKQTLGGQSVLNEESTPQYMIGTFRKGISLPWYSMPEADLISQVNSILLPLTTLSKCDLNSTISMPSLNKSEQVEEETQHYLYEFQKRKRSI